MVQIKFKQPLLISGALITEEVLRQLRYMQTGTAWENNPPRPFNNEGVTETEADITKLVYATIDNVVNASNEEEKKEAITMLEYLYELRSSLNSFKVPEDMLSE